jgi:hypothetical protein
MTSRTLAQLKVMDVRRLRYSIHKKFDHPMCFEGRGVCLAVDPCGDGPFVVFIGVDGRVSCRPRHCLYSTGLQHGEISLEFTHGHLRFRIGVRVEGSGFEVSL